MKFGHSVMRRLGQLVTQRNKLQCDAPEFFYPVIDAQIRNRGDGDSPRPRPSEQVDNTDGSVWHTKLAN